MNMAARINTLKKEKNALILSHYYQSESIREISDSVSDSFELAKQAQAAESDLIVVCGVHFMAESAKILSPEKKVLIPVPDAGCPMADMITPQDVMRLRTHYPDAAVMCYVNSSAAVKAVSDVCCTSSSAVRIATSLPQKQIIFIPDKNLGAYVASALPEKEIILWEGFCPVHNRLTREHVLTAKSEGALLLAHPECRPEILELSDFIGSTSQILQFAKKTEMKDLIIGTEIEIASELQKSVPGKNFRTAADFMLCDDMKKTTTEDVLQCLEKEQFEITLTPEEIAGARGSLERMLEL
jgi:quinolinate synthase